MTFSIKTCMCSINLLHIMNFVYFYFIFFPKFPLSCTYSMLKKKDEISLFNECNAIFVEIHVNKKNI